MLVNSNCNKLFCHVYLDKLDLVSLTVDISQCSSLYRPCLNSEAILDSQQDCNQVFAEFGLAFQYGAVSSTGKFHKK